MSHPWTLRIAKKPIPIACLVLVLVLVESLGVLSDSASSSPKKTRVLSSSSEVVQHPLDPLTSSEYLLVQSVLRKASLLGGWRQVLVSVDLHDPEKQEVLGWKWGEPIPSRRAEVIMTFNTKPHRIVVDLQGSGRVVENSVIPGSGYPPLSPDADNATAYIPATYQPFRDSMAARGINVDDTLCEASSPGWFNVAAEENRIVAYISCWDTKGTANIYMRPIEGVTIVVDVTTLKVLRYLDVLKRTVPKSEGTDYRYAKQKGPFLSLPKPGVIEHPSFTLDGHYVKWAGWEFHVRPNWRSGNVISQVKLDGRSVLYQAFLSEIFVPYQSPETDWYWRAYFDLGEYGIGWISLPLQPLNDCPGHAKYLDATFSGPDGSPYVVKNFICIFEQYAGDIAWHHTEDLSVAEVRVLQQFFPALLVFIMVCEAR
jgi:primary-amine oxidase